MKIKKRFGKIVAGIALAFCCVFGFLTFATVPTYAAAVVNLADGGGGGSSGSGTTPLYGMQFNYTITTTSGTGGGSGTTTTSGTGYSVSFQTAQTGTQSATVSIYGSSASGTGNFPIGGYITSRTVNLAINSSISQGTITVKNSSGTQIGSGGKTLTLTGLADGTYTVSLFFGSGAWATSARSGVSKSTSGSTSFIVDCTAPTVSGASTSTTGKYTNTAFTVSSSDSGSGVKALYMKAPGSSTYSTSGTSVAVPAGSANGLYSFYATDNAGNSSATYYVYYDTTLPSGTIKNASGTALTSGSYTNGAFSYSATDTGSGVSYLQYKTPGSSSWTTYTSGTTIAATATNGQYQFRAIDKAGNTSAVSTIYLDTAKPTGTLYGGTTSFSSGSSTKASYVKFVPSDTVSGIKSIYVKTPGASSYTTYTSGSQLTTNGMYYFYAIDGAGNSSVTYSLKLDNTAPVLTCSQTGFYTTIGRDFTVSASDAISTVKLYYKTPLMDSFALASGSSYAITTNGSDGKYYFYAEDGLGNVSETKWIELSVTKPTATIIRDGTTNKYKITWDDSSTGMLNNNPYTKNSWISTEGEYTFVITNTSGRSNTYNFTIAHSFVIDEVVAPTCTEQGYSVYRCITCGYTYHYDFVEANGHHYSSELIGESCTEGSYYLYTCDDCGHQYKSDYLTAGGHKYTKTVVKPTCLERGYTIYKCYVCGYTFYDDYVAAKGHTYKTTVTAPTCQEYGFTTYKCKDCDYSYVADYVSPTGHDYVTSVVEPTCTEPGHTLHKCSYCGEEYKTDLTTALGHYYVESTVDVTCGEDGYIKHSCVRCGYEYKTDIVKAIGHKYVSEVTNTATCTEDGHRNHLCERCGDQYVTDIPAFGHQYEITDVSGEGGVTIRTYACTVCGHSYTQDLGDQYEEVSNYVEYLFQQYSPYMMYVFLATAGVWSIAMGIAMIIARKNEDKEKAKKMLVNYCIGLVVIFTILIAAPYLVRGIAALVAG